MIRVLVADDHPIVRQGLKAIISAETDMVVNIEAENAKEALSLLREKNCDVLILDINMPGRNGLEILQSLHKNNPKLAVLILSVHPEEHYAIRALKSGAAGYLTKDRAPEELVKAVRKVAAGRKYVSSSLAEKLAFGLEVDADKEPHELLSDREFQVMRMIASGKTVGEISEELYLSVKTISTYRSRILKKMNMNTNSQLTYYAIKSRLVD